MARSALRVVSSRGGEPPLAGIPAIRPYYETRPPSPQTIVDIFGGSWKSSLPGGVRSGAQDMFADRRMEWLAAKLPGGLQSKSILELGPFEAYQTYQLEQRGVREIVAVEGNSINFLKCLCVKEIHGLRASFVFGDIQSYLDCCDRNFDLVCASGVLYHSQEPVKLLEQAMRVADHLYVWTHFHAPAILELDNGQEKHFVAGKNRKTSVGGRDITLHARSYLIGGYRSNLPLYWEGGQQAVAYWLSKEDLFWLIRHFGFEVVAEHGGKGRGSGLPCIGLYARRRGARAPAAGATE